MGRLIITLLFTCDLIQSYCFVGIYFSPSWQAWKLMCTFLETQTSSVPMQIATSPSVRLQVSDPPDFSSSVMQVQSQVGDSFVIPQAVVRDAAQRCWSRRNLTGRLANSLFTKEEKHTSNCRGIKKKRPDISKTNAIRRACIAQFPSKQHETEQMIEEEVREGIDEMCWRSVRKN